MILWTGPTDTEPREVVPGMGPRSFRWVLNVRRWHLSLDREYAYPSGGNAWHENGEYVSLGLHAWEIAAHHVYNDGCHRCWRLGWIEIGLSAGEFECRECRSMP